MSSDFKITNPGMILLKTYSLDSDTHLAEILPFCSGLLEITYNGHTILKRCLFTFSLY